MKPNIKLYNVPTLHRDGTVSWWSVYAQRWLRTRPELIPARERAAMSEDYRRLIWGGWWTIVSSGGAMVTAYPTDWPRGPWRSEKEARAALERWAARRGVADLLGTIRAAHNIRIVGPFRSREVARTVDITDYARHLVH